MYVNLCVCNVFCLGVSWELISAKTLNFNFELSFVPDSPAQNLQPTSSYIHTQTILVFSRLDFFAAVDQMFLLLTHAALLAVTTMFWLLSPLKLSRLTNKAQLLVELSNTDKVRQYITQMTHLHKSHYSDIHKILFYAIILSSLKNVIKVRNISNEMITYWLKCALTEDPQVNFKSFKYLCMFTVIKSIKKKLVIN